MLILLLSVCLLSYAACFLLIKFPYSRLLDHPGERSLHDIPVQRSGGIGVMLALFVGVIWYFPGASQVFNNYVLVALLILCAISLFDDFMSVSPLMRLLAQLVVAVIIVFPGEVVFMPSWLSGNFYLDSVCQLLSVIIVAWSINLYNFMDGMDGFAGGMALWGFGSLAALGMMQGNWEFVILNLMVVAAVLGFVLWNFPPAKIFLGDMGSTALGCLMAVLSLRGYQLSLYSFWVPVVIFAPFWVDASYTLVRRVLAGEKFWLPHRKHFYQRLVLSGMSHRRVVLWEYGLMGLGCVSVLLSSASGVGYNGAVPLLFIAGYVMLIFGLESKLASTISKSK